MTMLATSFNKVTFNLLMFQCDFNFKVDGGVSLEIFLKEKVCVQLRNIRDVPTYHIGSPDIIGSRMSQYDL